jgi:hypothetical protein
MGVLDSKRGEIIDLYLELKGIGVWTSGLKERWHRLWEVEENVDNDQGLSCYAVEVSWVKQPPVIIAVWARS